MKAIVIHDKKFVPFIDAQKIQEALVIMTQRIALEMGDEIPVFIGVLNGSFMVVSDFMKYYAKPCELAFIKLASYEGTATTHKVKELIGLDQDLRGRTVIVLEDIIDTGNTLVTIKKMLDRQDLKQIKIATLFYKPEVYKKDIKIDYIGIEIPNKFIVGFGLDYDGFGRNIPEVYQLKEN